MNFNFYIFGNPNGYNQYPPHEHSEMFQAFAKKNQEAESQLIIKRTENLVYYVYVRQLQENSNSFIGFCLVFNGVYCRYPKKLFKVFEKAYKNLLIEGIFLKIDESNIKYHINSFYENIPEAERIETFIKEKLELEFSQDFLNISLEFKFGNAPNRISLRNDDNEIIALMAQHEVLHITSTETSVEKPNHVSIPPGISRNFSKRIFFACTILFLFFFYKSSENETFLNFLLPSLTLLSFMYMYGVSNILHDKFYKPASYIFPLYVSLSISFGLISLVFGLHNDLLNSYDKNNYEDSYSWKWMKISEIIKFPLAQINSKKFIPPHEVNFSDLQKKDITCHVIVIDKTLSVKSSGNEVDSFLRSKIESTFNVGPDKLKKTKTSDLIPPYIFSGLYDVKKDSSSEYVSMWYYSGEKQLRFLGNGTDNYTIEINKKIKEYGSNFINDYFTKVEEYQKEGGRTKNQRSELSDIINSLNNDVLSKTQINCHKNIKFTIISDFINSSNIENDLDFQKVDKINHLNLYCMEGFDSDNPTCSSMEIVDKATDNYSLLKPKKVVNFKKQNQNADFFEEICLLNCKYFDNANKKNIEFYSPYSAFNTKEQAKSYIHFVEADLAKNQKKKYAFRIIDNSGVANKIPITYKISTLPNEVVKDAGDIFTTDIVKDDTIEISLPRSNSILNNDHLSLEVSSIDDSKTEALSVIIKPRMPDTTSYYLMFCYAVFAVSVALLLILPNWFILLLILREKIMINSILIHVLSVVSLGLLISLGLFWIVFFFKTFNNHGVNVFYMVIVMLILLGFCLPRFFYTYRSYCENKEPEQFNLFGSLISDAKFFLFSKGGNS